ncbi:MAG: hypothetical protein KI792_14670 [Alphaproteobacteria bacterium]|nr:hypothetical protein [Alphaproteobacteria bacterium SS10]MBV6634266.1 hypothetical protein [Alphaproteobacteria bacterium SS10]
MTQPPRTSETAALLGELRRDGYGQSAHDATIASVASAPAGLSLRGVISHASWTNPNGEPITLSAKDSYLHDLPRAQARAIVAVQDVVAKRPLGRALLKTARSGGVDFDFARLQADAIASYDHGIRRQSFNSSDPLPADPDVFIGAAANSTAHELTHCQQLAKLGEQLRQLPDSVDDLTIQLDHRILANRHLEAAANAVAIQIAFDNKQAGDDRMWSAMERSGGDQHQKIAFEAAVMADPAAAHDGRARRAAHDAFFDLTGYIGQYDDQLIKMTAEALIRIAERQFIPQDDMGDRMRVRSLSRWEHSVDELAMLGDMPDGVNHLTLPGQLTLNDEKYAGPTTEQRAGQVMYLIGLTEQMRIQEIVTPDALERFQNVESRTEAADLLSKFAPVRHSSVDLKRWRSKAEPEAPEPAMVPAPAA